MICVLLATWDVLDSGRWSLVLRGLEDLFHLHIDCSESVRDFSLPRTTLRGICLCHGQPPNRLPTTKGAHPLLRVRQSTPEATSKPLREFCRTADQCSKNQDYQENGPSFSASCDWLHYREKNGAVTSIEDFLSHEIMATHQPPSSDLPCSDTMDA